MSRKRGTVLVVDARIDVAEELGHKLSELGYLPCIVESADRVVPSAQETAAEVALLHLNFIDQAGGIVSGFFLRMMIPWMRIVAYTGSRAAAGLAVAKELGLADSVVTTPGLLEDLGDILPFLVAGARNDRAAARALDKAEHPSHTPGSQPPTINLARLHDALDRTTITQLLEWLCGVRPTARALQMDPSTLRWKMRKLGIVWPRSCVEDQTARGSTRG